MNQLNYRLSHPVAALQTSLTKDMDKYSRIRFDYASFDAQVFGKQPLMGTNHDQEVSPFPDCKFRIFYLAIKIKYLYVTMLGVGNNCYKLLLSCQNEYYHVHQFVFVKGLSSFSISGC